MGDWITAQESVINENGPGMTWSMVTTGPYMDMLCNVSACEGPESIAESQFPGEQVMFGPLKRREDGTPVFVTPIGNGHVPMIALEDIGFFARYTFDHRAETSGRELLVASDVVGWEYLRETFERVTGRKAEVIYVGIDEWMKNFDRTDNPIANERSRGDGTTTWKQNFTGWWSMWRDDIIKRDLQWIRSIHPNGYTLEKWMKEKGYTGTLRTGENSLLKNTEDDKTIRPNWDVINSW